ncbi:AraC family transcriptional regulator [Massilia sp. TS11]|uniref:AraC family transcriptional regulator n=1 Tax=Massilia sp. TS11 TaxID=2908003 RepID=UPI001EDC2857|nr:AraC family transcriptional regulator [Massilia sp. TS11]MCG2585026.1 AraC family transcriptional regulator [Massilia sp. TS11]
MLTSFTRADPDDRSAEQVRLTVMRAELANQLERHTGGADGVYPTAIPALTLVRASQSTHPSCGLFQPAFCMLARGSKRLMLCDEVYIYDPTRYLVVSQNLPLTGQVVNASSDMPYLGLKLEFDAREIASLVLELKQVEYGRGPKCPRGLYTGDVTTTLLDATLRLVNLLDTPEDIPTLAALITREILYRLLRSNDGWALAQMAMKDTHSNRITQAISWLQTHYREPLHVAELAREVHMSVSSLHSHFKAVTAMSPLQFQKLLRLQEARRIMLTEAVDAGLAGHRVGYESQSQFNREYSRLFGAPPARDIKRLREEQLA